MVPGRKTKYKNITGEVELEMAWMPLVANPGDYSNDPWSSTRNRTTFGSRAVDARF